MTAVVHVVDDDEDVRTSLARLLRTEGFDVRVYASAGEFLLDVPKTPGCILLDLEMPGPSGLDLQQALQRDAVALPIVFLTGRGSIASGVRAMKAGAVDFLTKPVEPEPLLAAVAAALARDRAARELEAKVARIAALESRLTAREREVFREVVAGKLNKQIADSLGITLRTVKLHRSQVMAKMDAKSLAELVHLAETIGLVGGNSSIDRPR